LSKIFFEELEIPEPDVNLAVGSGSQAEQTGRIMIEFEKDLSANPTDMVVVVGDVKFNNGMYDRCKKASDKGGTH
jgi:UDP-N-acetylglucosamine 2-epimerase (non-hydrolysing)